LRALSVALEIDGTLAIAIPTPSAPVKRIYIP